MIVVESLAHSSDRHREILHRHDVLVVRFVAEHVRHAIDEESDVQSCAEATDEARPKGNPKALVPIKVRH